MYSASIILVIISFLTLIASIICLYLVLTKKDFKKNPKIKKNDDPFTDDYCKDGCSLGKCTKKCKYGKKCCLNNSDCLNCKDRVTKIHYPSKVKKPKIKGKTAKEIQRDIKIENDKIKTLNEDIKANNNYIKWRHNWLKNSN